jgi:hypothetical protein
VSFWGTCVLLYLQGAGDAVRVHASASRVQHGGLRHGAQHLVRRLHLQVGVSTGHWKFRRDFDTVLSIQQGFQQGPYNPTGVSKGSLQLNRGFNGVLKIQQGFEKGPSKAQAGPHHQIRALLQRARRQARVQPQVRAVRLVEPYPVRQNSPRGLLMNSSGITHNPVGSYSSPEIYQRHRAARLAGSQSRNVATSDLVRLRFSWCGCCSSGLMGSSCAAGLGQ